MSYCNATEPTFDELITLQQFGGYFSCVGVVLLVPLLLSKLIVPQFRAFPSRLSTLFVSCSLGWNITIVVGLTQDWKQLWLAKLEGKQSTTFCKVQGMLIQFFISTQILLWLEITMGMYLLIIKKKTFTDISKYESYFHSFWIVGGSLMTFVPALIWEPVPQLGASYCWLTEDYDYAIQIGFLHCEMGLALIGGSILISKVLYRLFQISRSFGDDSSTTKQVIQSYVWRHAMFAVSFCCVFVIVGLFVANQILSRYNVWCLHLPMAYFHSVAVSGSGIISFMVLSRMEYYQAAREHLVQCYMHCTSVERDHDNESNHLLEQQHYENGDVQLLN